MKRGRHRQTRSRARRWLASFLIGAIHLPPLTALFAGANPADWMFFAVQYGLLAFCLAAGLHRYFAHGAFRTSRSFQFAMGVMATTTYVDPIGFTGSHRIHHREADGERDVHSPRQGFWFCWFSNHVDEGYTDEEVDAMAPDLTRYPELRWLRRHKIVPGLVLAVLTFWLGGYSMFAIGFCLPRVVAFHLTSAVNYFGHGSGTRRYLTRDDSTNNALVSLLTLGEGWHNNHHFYPASARAGIGSWELDLYYYALKLLEKVGLVWHVREPPIDVMRRVSLAKTAPAAAAR
jgi:stearoyl-CoA desaturase (delta-9 desaturase)